MQMTDALMANIQDEEWSQLIERVASSPEDRYEVLRRRLGDGACRQLGVFPLPTNFKLSVVIPVYNERRWVRELLERVQAVPIPKEIIVVDDCSTDGTRDILKSLEGDGL